MILPSGKTSPYVEALMESCQESAKAQSESVSCEFASGGVVDGRSGAITMSDIVKRIGTTDFMEAAAEYLETHGYTVIPPEGERT